MRIFLSYSRRDKAIADDIVSQLEARGFEVLIDRQDLPYGEEWQPQLAAMIRQCDTIVWLASQASVGSKWCNWELGEAQRLSKRLLPVRISPLAAQDLPEALGRIHILPVEGVYDPSQHLDDLVRAIETDRAWMETHTRLADRATEWIARGRTADRVLRGRALRDAEEWRDSRPERAPAPSTDILDLLLQSRRAATRGLRTLLGVALVVATAMIGLAIFAGLQWQVARFQETEALAQAKLARDREAEATEQRAEAELQGARLATTLAASLPARGQSDQALLLLLDAAQTLGDDASAELKIALDGVLSSVDGRTIISIPPGALAFETRNGLYFEDPASHNLWHLNDDGSVSLELQGVPGDSPFAAMDMGPNGLIAIRADLEVISIAGGHNAPLGRFTGPDSAYPRGMENNDIWSIHPDGTVLRRPPATTAEVMDTVAGWTMPFPGFYAVYYRAPDGRRYLVDASMGDETNRHDTLEIVGSSLVPRPPDDALYDEARFADCMLAGNSRPYALREAAIAELYEPNSYRVRCAIMDDLDYTDDFLVTKYLSGPGAMNRHDTIVEAPEDGGERRTDTLDDRMEYAHRRALGEGDFTWAGVSKQTGMTGGVFNRGVYIIEGYQPVLARQESEPPSMGAFLGDDRLAVVLPRAGRIAIYDYTRGQFRPSFMSPLDADINVTGYDNLNVNYCGAWTGYEVTTPGGERLVLSGDQDDDGRPTLTSITIRAPDGDRRIELPTGTGCSASGDWRWLLLLEPALTRLVDVERLAVSGDIQAATIALLDTRLVRPSITAGGVIFSLRDDYTIERWTLDEASGALKSTVVYEGERRITDLDPDTTGTLLLITEQESGPILHGFLYSIEARSTWMDLGSVDFQYFLDFTKEGDIVRGTPFLSAFRLPSLPMMIEEAKAALPAVCAPATPDDYRSSPCWPAWL